MVVEAMQGDDDGPGLLAVLGAPAQIGQPGAVLNHEGAAAEGSRRDARAAEAVGWGLGRLKVWRGAGGQGERDKRRPSCPLTPADAGAQPLGRAHELGEGICDQVRTLLHDVQSTGSRRPPG
ncbi:hypothetical protein D3C72_1825700 [compost metagenome]